MGRIEIGEHLVADLEVCHGRLTFKVTRVPVETVLTFLSMAYTIEDVLQDWKRFSLFSAFFNLN